MRACEGCRRRKIKCDAATTNTWPCSACNRLKQLCVPPTMIDQDSLGADHATDLQDASTSDLADASDLDLRTVRHPKPPSDHGSRTSYGQFQINRQIYQPPLPTYAPHTQFYSANAQQHSYDNLYQSTTSTADDGSGTSQAFYTSRMAPIARTASDASEHGSSKPEDLSEALGELKIDESGIGGSSLVTFWRKSRANFSRSSIYAKTL
jgi:Fungal Zn(2)-Cys(6) binuclear cluster domain